MGLSRGFNENDFNLKYNSKRSVCAQAVCDTPIARVAGCVLVKDLGRQFPLELQCSLYQGQQGDATQSVRGSY